MNSLSASAMAKKEEGICKADIPTGFNYSHDLSCDSLFIL